MSNEHIIVGGGYTCEHCNRRINGSDIHICPEAQKVSAEAAGEGVPERIWVCFPMKTGSRWWHLGKPFHDGDIEYARVSPVTVDEAAELKQAVRDYLDIDPAENAAEWCAASNNLLRLVGLPVDHAPTPRAPDVGAEAVAQAVIDEFAGCMLVPDGYTHESFYLRRMTDVIAALTSPAPVVDKDGLRRAAQSAQDVLHDITESRAYERISEIGKSRVKSVIFQLRESLAASPVPSKDDQEGEVK